MKNILTSSNKGKELYSLWKNKDNEFISNLLAIVFKKFI